ncbi:Protein F38B7.3 [Aphelenchoides avenae]|nr:Protein F38B7.3 [Aphelenchus avenae]
MKSDKAPIASVFLDVVASYMCVGEFTRCMPTYVPRLPQGACIQHLLGIGMDPKAEKVHWLLFASDSDMDEWFRCIAETMHLAPVQLPRPSGRPEGHGSQQRTSFWQMQVMSDRHAGNMTAGVEMGLSMAVLCQNGMGGAFMAAPLVMGAMGGGALSQGASDGLKAAAMCSTL